MQNIIFRTRQRSIYSHCHQLQAKTKYYGKLPEARIALPNKLWRDIDLYASLIFKMTESTAKNLIGIFENDLHFHFHNKSFLNPTTIQ